MDPDSSSRSILICLGLEMREMTEKQRVTMNTKSQIHLCTLDQDETMSRILSPILSLNVWMHFPPSSSFPFSLSFTYPTCSGRTGNQESSQISDRMEEGRGCCRVVVKCAPMGDQHIQEEIPPPKCNASGACLPTITREISTPNPSPSANGIIIEFQMLPLELMKWCDASSKAFGKYLLNQWMKKWIWRDSITTQQ